MKIVQSFLNKNKILRLLLITSFFLSIFIIVIDLTINNYIQESTTIVINDQISYQEIDGFGASLSDSSAWLMHSLLNHQDRKKLLFDLLGSDKGIGLNILRISMGPSDFSFMDYTYTPNVSDLNLDNFSLSFDEEFKIPILQEALLINPNLKIIAVPWSAPIWMKDSNDLYSGSLKKEYFELYALYFVKFIQGYSKNGIPIYAVSLQNEPFNAPCDYPCMFMNENDQIKFSSILGVLFEKYSIESKIYILEHNWENSDEAITILKDPVANSFISGVTFHCYKGDINKQLEIKRTFPDKEIHLTECSGGNWSTDFKDNLFWDVSSLIIGSTRNWAQSILKWNLILDENNGPHMGGCTNCRGVVTIDTVSRKITHNEEYYSLGHFSKFVKTGARRIYSSPQENNINNIAFINKNGIIVVVVVNNNKIEKNIVLVWNNQNFQISIPRESVTTITWDSRSNINIINSWTTTGDKRNLLENHKY